MERIRKGLLDRLLFTPLAECSSPARGIEMKIAYIWQGGESIVLALAKHYVLVDVWTACRWKLEDCIHTS